MTRAQLNSRRRPRWLSRGAALLSLATNTASIVGGITGADASTATRSIFSTLAKQSQSDLANILVGEDETDGTKVLGLIKGSLNEASGIDDYVASLGGTDTTNLEAILDSSASAIRDLTAAMNKVDMTASGGPERRFCNGGGRAGSVKGVYVQRSRFDCFCPA